MQTWRSIDPHHTTASGTPTVSNLSAISGGGTPGMNFNSTKVVAEPPSYDLDRTKRPNLAGDLSFEKDFGRWVNNDDVTA